MARPLRIEFPNAIYHVMARGNGRRAIFHGEDDYQRITDGLAKTVGGFSGRGHTTFEQAGRRTLSAEHTGDTVFCGLTEDAR